MRDHALDLYPKYPCSLAQAISCHPFTRVLNLVISNPGCQQPNPFILGVQQQLFFELLSAECWASRTHPRTMYQTVTSQSHIGMTSRGQMPRTGTKELGFVRSHESHERQPGSCLGTVQGSVGGVVLGEQVRHPDPWSSGLGSSTPRFGVP